jgi:hypothetical protein
MRIILITLTLLAHSAAAQICMTRNGEAAPVTLDTYQLWGREYLTFEFYMARPGYCKGRFNVGDARREVISGSALKTESVGRLSPPFQDEAEILIFDGNNYGWFRAGMPVPTEYSSGRVSAGEFHVRLGRGIHYLVLNNRYETFISKIVFLSFGGDRSQPDFFDECLDPGYR